MTMMPRDIWEWKIQWLPNSFDVKVHIDIVPIAIDWCKANCEAWQWDLEKYTHPYHHTFMFENEVDANDLNVFLMENKDG